VKYITGITQGHGVAGALWIILISVEVQFAVAKVSKYAASESGDTLEMVERPNGGISMVLVDGQRSGKSAKAISNIVARKAIQLLGEGVRDGAAARAAHDYLYTNRKGKVSATLNIVSVDAVTRTIVVSRNSEMPVIVHTAGEGFFLLDTPSQRVGTHRNTKPVITEIPIQIGTAIVVFTDGLRHAGDVGGSTGYDPLGAANQLLLNMGVCSAQAIADQLLADAVALDDGRPRDDISVLVVTVGANDAGDLVRRLAGRLALSI
jgi:serine phosphatase RsbU (regulator of sigma subunit)